MVFAPEGKHPVADEWLDGEGTFASVPAYGPVHHFAVGTVELANRACEAAEEAFWSYGYSPRAGRAAFLRAIAGEIEAYSEAITEIGSQESVLPDARVKGEWGRTTGQLRLLADPIETGDYLDCRFDAAMLGRQPAPRPGIRPIQRPVGPVAVLGASNFPLASSTAGGDTAASLAAGCPVAVKGHSAHPGTGEIVALAVDAAIRKTSVHPGSPKTLTSPR